MAENNKHIDDLFKESLGNSSEVPDASVWSDIELKLDTMPAPGPSGSGGGGAEPKRGGGWKEAGGNFRASRCPPWAGRS